MADLSNMSRGNVFTAIKQPIQMSTGHYIYRFSSQMDLKKFALFVFFLNLGIFPLTVKGMPVSSFHRRPLQSAFVRSYT